ncbi:hypothetical protein GCM10028805_51850 [Spirosoma harenae]
MIKVTVPGGYSNYISKCVFSGRLICKKMLFCCISVSSRVKNVLSNTLTDVTFSDLLNLKF